MTQALESMLENTFVPTRTVDKYEATTTALYTPPLFIYDFPNLQQQLHIHGSNDGNTLYGGGWKNYGEDNYHTKLNGYECAMQDFKYQNNTDVKLILPKQDVDYSKLFR